VRLILCLYFLTSHPSFLAAQYNPIPNFTGTLAGQQFRNALNNKLGGSDTIAPQLTHLYFYQLPAAPVTGQMYYLIDGTPGVPCKGGGSGALAFGVNGKWTCSAMASQVQNVLAYGAKGDGVILDDIAIQAAIDSTPNDGNRGANAVYLPATQGGSNAYLLGRPLYLHQAGTHLYGDGPSASLIETNYFGPSIIAENNQLALVTSLLSGPGNALDLSANGAFLELSMLLRNRLSGHSAFSIEFELKVPSSPANSRILSSLYDDPYQRYKRFGSTDNGAFNVNYQSSNPHLNVQVTLSTSGLVSANTANNSMAAGNHAVGVYYDGAHVWTCADGTASTPVAAAGTWVQSPWESITLPDYTGSLNALYWPDGGGAGGNSSFNGQIDNIRFSNVARAASGNCPSVPTQKFTYDSNTDLLMTFNGCSDGSQYCIENTSGKYAIYAQGRGLNGNAAWFPVLGLSSDGSNHFDVHDLEICANISGNWDCQGMYVVGAPWSRYARLRSFSSANGFNFFALDFLGSFTDLEAINGSGNGFNSFEWGDASNNSHTWNLRAEQALVCFNYIGSQTGIDSHGDHCLVNGAMAFGIVSAGGATGTFHDFFIDQEAADSNWLANAYLWGLGPHEGSIEFVGGNLDTYGGAPFVVHEGAQYGSVNFHGTLFNNFAEDQPGAELLQFYTPGGGSNADPLNPDLLENVTVSDSNIALSNETGNPHVETLGGTGGTQLQQLSRVGDAYSAFYSAAGTPLPTCNAAENHVRLCASDATACTNGTTYAGSGAVACVVNCNGTNWKETGAGCY